MNDLRQVLGEAQAIVMKVLDCDSIEAAEVIRKRAETEQRSVIAIARAIAANGVANFTDTHTHTVASCLVRIGVPAGMAHEQIETARIESRWIVARYGVQQPQFLSPSGVWDTIGNAAWFVDKAASHAAVCPPGTTGIAVRMGALREAS